MKEIILNDNSIALVDDEDYDKLKNLSWYIQKGRYTNYAMHSTRVGKKVIHIGMHNLVTGIKLVDHRDSNGLNNQKQNLRSCTNSQNMQSRSKTWSKSGFKGVSYCRRDFVYIAAIGINGKSIRIGSFSTGLLAAKAYDTKALEIFGEFAKTNKMLGLY